MQKRRQAASSAGTGHREALAKKFGVDTETYACAKEVDDLAPNAAGNSVALIHVDGTGFGQIFKRLSDELRGRAELADIRRKLSDIVSDVTRCAAKQAVTWLTEQVGENAGTDGNGARVLPLRPVVLGGDDMTAFVGARYALGFTLTFLHSFAAKSERRLVALRGEVAECLNKAPKEVHRIIPARLAAGAGMAIVHKKYPALLALDLAEELTSAAKKPVRDCTEPPCTLAFHRLGNGGVADYETIRAQELTATVDNQTHRLTLCPYTVGPGGEGLSLPDVAALAELDRAARDLPAGPRRELLALAHGDATWANQRFQRLLDVAAGDPADDEAKAETAKEAVEAFAAAHAALTGQPAPNLENGAWPRFWPQQSDTETPANAWADIAALRAIDSVEPPVETKE